MSEPVKAVFLSYAHEDASAARRIANALTAADVKVWLDESELRGGDAFDANIHRQIHECALFVPIVSAQTETRKEGYFRREWKLAVARLDDIADGVPFLVPVCLDETPERAALVPGAFLRVQWTRLRPNDAPDTFVQRVRQLLGHSDDSGRRTDDGGRTKQDGPQPAEAGGQGPGLARTGRPSGAKWLLAAAALAIGGGAYFALRPEKETIASASNPKLTTQSPKPLDFAPAKSIAVLPFANLSDDKDASAFFSDGIHEDILTNLSNIRELRVVSRTSVMGYRGTTKKMAEIARELGVAFILEGSVRRAGNRVRVTGQLIRAATDEHIWAKNFDRDLTDIFAIQSELSQAIAGDLKAAISPEEKKLLEQRPTQNIAAYELVLKAREVRARNVGAIESQAQLLQSALQLDPSYATAHAELGYIYAASNFFGASETNAVRQSNAAKSKAAIDKAIRLAPDSPDVIRALGDYFYYAVDDYPRAMEQYRQVLHLRPNDGETYNRIGSVQRRQALWRESLASFRKAEELDPTNLNYVGTVINHLAAGRRFDEAIAQVRRRLELASSLQFQFNLAFLHYMAKGTTREMDEFFAGLSPAQLNSNAGIAVRKQWALRHGDLDEAIRLDRGTDANVSSAIDMAVVFAVRGDRQAVNDRLTKWADGFRSQSQTDGALSYSRRPLALIEALLGRKEEALRAANTAIALKPEARDAMLGVSQREILAFVHAWTGDRDAALTEYAHILRAPYGSGFLNGSSTFPQASVHVMKSDPRYAPLRGDPRFEALLNDPKNNAPLF